MTPLASTLRQLRGPLGALAVAAGAFFTARCSTNNTTSSDLQGQTASQSQGPTSSPEAGGAGSAAADPVLEAARATVDEGRRIFRFDTFGDEDYWGGTLKLHQALEGKSHGGIGAGVSPAVALGVGLKVDVDALPPATLAALQMKQIDLNSPESTLALLKLNAVIGVTATFDSDQKNITTLGIQCAFCHSTVDDSVTAGIGHRLDGWPNRDLNVGAIVNLSPDLSSVASLLKVPEATVRQVLLSWGPGKFDAELLLDGKALRPDGKSAATLIPPAFGLQGINLHTWTGWGSIPYWNAFVANIEMHGKGTFFDPRLDNAAQFPIAAAAGFGHIRQDIDLISSKLPALHVYQLALRAPKPPAGSFDARAADRGNVVFNGAGRCASCHVPPTFSEPGWDMHTGQEIGIDEFQASRSPDRRYRTSPLRGMFAHTKGGFYHDGRFATLADVVEHYDQTFKLGLAPSQKADLVEYIKSL